MSRDSLGRSPSLSPLGNEYDGVFGRVLRCASAASPTAWTSVAVVCAYLSMTDMRSVVHSSVGFGILLGRGRNFLAL